MQLQLITTESLIQRQDDLLNYAFSQEWQKGVDGVITSDTAGTDIELPCNFASASMELTHWFDNEILDNEAEKITLAEDKRTLPLPILNIPNRGFFKVKSISSNQVCVLDVVTPAFNLAMNRWRYETQSSTDLTTGTALEWSLGGFEGKIAIAYETLLSDLTMADSCPTGTGNLDASYKQAIEFKALEMICNSLTKQPDDHFYRQSYKYRKEYQNQLNSVTTNSSLKIACKEWNRT